MLWLGGGAAVILMLVPWVMLLVGVPPVKLPVLALLVLRMARAL